MRLVVSPQLRETAASFGAEGERWLGELPGRAEEAAEAWSLTVGPAFATEGCCSWVAPARLGDGSEAVLKVGIPHREARYEGAALRAFDGRGAVRLLWVSEDGFVLLLERCVPGTDLWSLPEETANEVGAAVLRELWRPLPDSTRSASEGGSAPDALAPEHPFDTVTDLARGWRESLLREGREAGYEDRLIARAVELAAELSATEPGRVLLHGDFHPGNVLAATRQPWLAIDCKPLVGEPAYDLAQWLLNRCEAAHQAPDPVGALRGQLERLSALLDLDPARVAGWAFVKSLGWRALPEDARLLYNVLG